MTVQGSAPLRGAGSDEGHGPRGGTVVVLAAGQGTRMKSPRAKVLHPVCGRALLGWVLDQAMSLGPQRVVLVLGDRREQIEAWLGTSGERARLEAAGVELLLAEQRPQRGTGHALLACLAELRAALAADGPGSPVVVLYGDMPLLTPESLAALLRARPAGGASLLTATVADPTGYGRILRTPAGGVRAIVEHKDASAAERAVHEVNVGVYAFPAELLPAHLERLEPKNAQGEYYLTDVVGSLVAEGKGVVAVPLEDPAEAAGVNTLVQLAEARAVLHGRILEAHMAAGVLIEDPASVAIDHGVEIGAGTHVLPFTVIRSGVRVGEGCEVGPFAHLRAGTVLENGAEVGNFTECKNAALGANVKAKHLSYLGDVTIGAGANIGAGTIVANYDGVHKHHTTIGERAFVGSGTILIAPSRVGDGALTGAGAVVKRGSDIPAGEAWVGLPARSRGPRPTPAKPTKPT